MNKKLLKSLLFIAAGIFIGWLVFSYFGSSRVKPYQVFSPKAPGYITDSSRAFSETVRAVSPAVVNISSTKTIRKQMNPFDDFFDFLAPFPDSRSKRREQSLGSGVIVSGDGYIVTNNHVVEKSDDIKVTLFDKRVFRAKVIGSDPKTDIAIVKINAKDLPVIPVGDSDRLQVGEFVLAIGNPFGLSHTVTMGIISAVGRADVGIADYEDFIQTDAAINPGNSGGPLVNVKGELIGINTAIFSKTGGYQGIGFAVPSNMVKLVMNQLLKEGKVTRGWIGVAIQELTPELGHKFGLKNGGGALVNDVVKGGPAQKAGLMRGDIIIDLNGKKIKDVATLRNAVSQTKIGSTVSMTILRAGREMTLSVSILELPADAEDAGPSSPPSINSFENIFAGMAVMDLNPAVRKQLGIDKDEKGVVILRIDPSLSEETGLRKGDVIQEIDKQRIENVNDFNRIISKIKPNDSALLFVNRSGRKFYLALEPR
ncbi:MAG: DegQ family serine endoprotease [Dissulfurispiraceae bacterium]|jgi:serine protease Do|nr:DegQ family serine endoprotease [Dissulfurispiraceae bacterium]